MARDYARLHTDIWGDDDWLDLSRDAQLLYLTLYTAPSLSLCGAGHWHAARLCKRAGDWDVERIEAAAEELASRLFLLIDADTEEYLIRSWVKHDGLWRTPNMAVSVANARADLASRDLRGAIVYEVLKLRDREPESKSWERDQVRKMLAQNPINPADITPFKGGSNGVDKGAVNGGAKGSANPYESMTARDGVKGGSNGGPTTTTTTTTTTKRGAAQQRDAHPKGTRIPDGWKPSPGVNEALAQECPRVDLNFELKKFVDYFLGKSGKDATKTNWDATWRNWVRRSYGSAAPARRSGDGLLGEAKPGGLWTER